VRIALAFPLRARPPARPRASEANKRARDGARFLGKRETLFSVGDEIRDRARATSSPTDAARADT